MALLIEKNLTVLGDIDLSQLYIRLTVSYGPEGEPVTVQTNTFSSKNAYTLNAYLNKFNVNGIAPPYIFTYNRETDGFDVLGYAHTKLKEYLSTDQIIEVPVLDPSTGEPTYDPSTGLAITEEVINIPKFAQDTSIFIVDISIA